jgi:RNA polymerase sigma-70 factor, ECF subfamily
MHQLRQMWAADVVAYADGGGKIAATTEPIVGLEDVMELHTSLARLFAAKKSWLVRYGLINGLPGFVSIEQGNVLQTTALEIENDKIVAIYVTRNPDKLRHLSGEVIQ